MADPLSVAQKQAFRRDGFVIVPHLFDGDGMGWVGLGWIQAWTDEVAAFLRRRVHWNGLLFSVGGLVVDPGPPARR